MYGNDPRGYELVLSTWCQVVRMFLAALLAYGNDDAAVDAICMLAMNKPLKRFKDNRDILQSLLFLRTQDLRHSYQVLLEDLIYFYQVCLRVPGVSELPVTKDFESWYVDKTMKIRDLLERRAV